MSVQSSTPEQPPRKKMRKGTHSCLECRRRKLRCVFQPDRPSICEECVARGLKCIDQESADADAPIIDQRQNLRERVGQLELMVKSILQRLDSNGEGEKEASSIGTIKSQLSTLSAFTPPSAELDLNPDMQVHAPVLSLFDNALFTRKDKDTGEEGMKSLFSEVKKEIEVVSSKDQELRRTMVALLPSKQDLDIILVGSSDWWAIWRTMFRDTCFPNQISVSDFVSQSVATGGPVILAKVLLIIAISLSQLSPTFIDRRLKLSMPPLELMEHYLSITEKQITSNDEYACTLDGLECMVLQTKWDINLGRPRKAWMAIRRAISFAEMLGLHRCAIKPERGFDELTRRKLNIWSSLQTSDRYLALLLGVPYAVADHHYNVDAMERYCAEISTGELYRLKLSVVSGHVVDRNQDLSSVCLSSTLKIDQELDDLTRSMPDEWWRHASGGQANTGDALDQLITQFWHHQIRAVLHQPFMLKASMDRKYEYSKFAATDSSREMIRIYQILRADAGTGGSYVCKVVDFQAFTAAMLLVINLLGSMYAPTSPSSNRDFEQEGKDWEMVNETVEILRRASSEMGGGAAAQAVRVLDLMNKARHGCNGQEQTAKIVIPYFGTIVVGPTQEFCNGDSQPGGVCVPRDSQMQLPTPPEMAPNFNEGATTTQGNVRSEDPFISFDSYFAPLPYEPDQNNLGQSGDVPWSNMLSVDLSQDWSWFLNGTEIQ